MAADILHLELILIVATALVLLFQLFKQPPIIAYIVTGLIVGPLALAWTGQAEFIELFGSFGIAFLLFLVGLNLDVRAIRQSGATALTLGIAQVFFTATFFWVVSVIMGFGGLEAIILALALTFSSTIIVVKMLSDKRDLDSLYGRLAIGVLIVQDVVAVLVLSFIGAQTPGGDLVSTLSGIFVRILFLGVALALAVKTVLPTILRAAGKRQETLFLFSITWCFALGILALYAGLSLEVGALLAGLLLASTTYSYEIASRIKPLRDFFIVLFFITLGAQMDIMSLQSILLPAVIISLLILLVKPAIIAGIMGFEGFTQRVAHFTSFSLSQISEFSFILIALAVQHHLVDQRIQGIVVLVGLITMTVSTYFMQHLNGVSKKLSFLPYYQHKVHSHHKKDGREGRKYHAIVFGAHRLGTAIVNYLQTSNKPFLVIDFNPERVMELQKMGVNSIFGDADDIELYSELSLESPEIIVSSLPEKETSKLLLSAVRSQNKKALVILTAQTPEEALELYEEGADYVVIPHVVGGDHATFMMELLFTDLEGFLQKKKSHVEKLKSERK